MFANILNTFLLISLIKQEPITRNTLQKVMCTFYTRSTAQTMLNPGTESIYRRVFNFKLNFSFHHPRKDTCIKSDIFKIKIEVRIDDDKKKLL